MVGTDHGTSILTNNLDYDINIIDYATQVVGFTVQGSILVPGLHFRCVFTRKGSAL